MTLDTGDKPIDHRCANFATARAFTVRQPALPVAVLIPSKRGFRKVRPRTGGQRLEVAGNATLQEVRLTVLPMSLSALAICRSLGSRNGPRSEDR
jgi:hypothetical protein